MTAGIEEHDESVEELRQGVVAATNKTHRFTLETASLRVRLPIDPRDASRLDDRFRLLMTTSEGCYEQVRSVADDLVQGDDAIDLIYHGLWPDSLYSLEIDPGTDGHPYLVFEDLSLSQLQSGPAKPSSK